jgi:hypothetical protein
LSETKTKPPRPSRRRYTLLIIAIVLVIAGWSAAWFYGRSVLAGEIDRQIAALNAQDTEISCMDLAIAGFPFRYEVSCREVQSADRWGSGGSVGGLMAVALIYNPWHVILEAQSPAAFTIPVNGLRGEVTFDTARASVKFSEMSLGSLAAVVEKPEAAVETAFSAGLYAAETAEAHLRTMPDRPQVLEGFLTVADLRLKSLPELQESISLRGHVRIDGGSGLLAGADLYSLVQANGEVPLELVLLETALGESRVTANGGLVLSGDGTLSGSLKVDIGNAEMLLQTLKPLLPRDGRTYSLLENIVKSLEPAAAEVDGVRTITLPVALDRGQIRVGFLPVGRIPPLFAAGT